MALEINKEFLEKIESLIKIKDDKTLMSLLSEEHPADIAEILMNLT